MSEKSNKSDYLPGNHYLLDFFGTKRLSDGQFILDALKSSALKAGATILDSKIHLFGENNGVTAVVLLAESHITIHTWPENNFAALDVFMCGNCDSQKAVDNLIKLFNPENSNIKEIKRGS